jgi:pimeloyl-ACP methyl ester carboxylesterase
MRIKLQDANIFVEDVGNGMPLLLIHGFPFNLELWRPQIEDLSTIARVIALDIRGHGQTPPTDSPYTMDMFANDCTGVLEALKVEQRAVVCGLSMGGYISFALLRRYPDKIGGLILAATRSGADSEEGKTNRDKAIHEVEKCGTQSVIESMLPIIMAPQTYTKRPELVSQVSTIMEGTSRLGMISALQAMKTRPDSSTTLTQIEVPTLIIQGANDQIIPVSEAEAMHAAITNSQLEIIPDAGHLPNLEQSQQFNKIVRSFLSTLNR